AAHHPGPRPALHHGTSASTARQWRDASRPAAVESEFERVCGTLCRVGQVGMLGADGTARESHLRAAVRAFMVHYHEERPHQGLGNDLIAPTTPVIGTGPVRCRERLGG